MTEQQIQETEHLNSMKNLPNFPLIQKLMKFMKSGFYFSYDYDLTASRQRRISFEKKFEDMKAEGKEVKAVDELACDSRYFWNRNIL